MALSGWLVRRVADGKAPSPTYAAIGVFDAVTTLPSSPRSLLIVASAWRDPAGRYRGLVERGWVRVVSDGAELAVRKKAPNHAEHLVGPARNAATVYVRSRSRMRSRQGRRTTG
jgi:hypothetical protein